MLKLEAQLYVHVHVPPIICQFCAKFLYTVNLASLPYPLMSSVSVMPLMEALNVTMFIVESPSVFSCSTVSLTTDSLPGPDTSTLPRYTSSHTVKGRKDISNFHHSLIIRARSYMTLYRYTFTIIHWTSFT